MKLILILFVAFGLSLALYGWVMRSGKQITSSKLVLTLLTKEDVDVATKLQGSLLPQLPQFSDQLSVEEVGKYGYKDLVAQIFVRKHTPEVIIENALTLFDTNQQAEQFIEAKAKESNNAKTSRSFEGKVLTLVLTSSGDKKNLPQATIRFAVGNVAARITVYGRNKVIDYTNPQLLTSVAMKLATVQKEKVEQLLAGKAALDGDLQTNKALRVFPTIFSETTFLGLVPITQFQWLGETVDEKRSAIPGFNNGAFGRFKLQRDADLVVDVTVIEFTSHQEALGEQSRFFREGVHLEDKSSKVLAVPEALKSLSVARTSDSIVELQAVKGTYFYDISVQAPFTEKLNKEKATEYLLKYSQEVLQ